MKKILPVIFIIGVILGSGKAFCQDDQLAEPGQESIYSYDEKNPPKVFFFPKDKARWDGSKVTMREWYTLTELQKERYISEYLGEMKKQYDGTLDAMGVDYLSALNLFSYYANDKSSNEPSTKFIDKILAGQGKLPQESSNQIKKGA